MYNLVLKNSKFDFFRNMMLLRYDENEMMVDFKPGD